MRASAVVEQAGVPTASLICDGFIGQAGATAPGLGIPGLPVARLVGHVDSQSDEELRGNVADITAQEVIRCLTTAPASDAHGDVHAAGEIVARGSFDEVNALFEAWIRQHPGQWWCAGNRWPKPGKTLSRSRKQRSN